MTASLAPPAHAYGNPISRGLADFLNIFSAQPVPRQVVEWRKPHSPGTVVGDSKPPGDAQIEGGTWG